LLLTACARSTPGEHELVSDAQDQARKFFALGEGGDCDQLSKLMQHPETCQQIVKQFIDTHTHLLGVTGAKLDGRDKDTVLVTVDAQEKAIVHHWIVRAKWTKEGWKLAL